jgi:hypothetical protein
LGDVTLTLRQADGPWRRVETAALAARGVGEIADETAQGKYGVTYRTSDEAAPHVEIALSWDVEADAVIWTIAVANLQETPVELGDVALPLPIRTPRDRTRDEGPFLLKHSFVGGHSSFVYWKRSDGVGADLLLLPDEATSLEYWDTTGPLTGAPSPAPDGGGQRRRGGAWHVYALSAAEGERVRQAGGTWRQTHTSRRLAPAGADGDRAAWQFRLVWADGRDAVRQALADRGLLDVSVVPGMTVPRGTRVQVALRTRQPIAGLEPEFPAETTVEDLGQRGEYRVYALEFARLGENAVRVRYGDERRTLLEFFATEPLETMIKKRGAFIAKRQHRDPDKWYRGLLAEWNMESQTLLGPDNYDRISGFRIYAVTCDDPGLSKPAFLASKLAEHPDAQQIAAMDDYLEHFVWGGLQCTEEEAYPFAIYGIQDWKRNRESEDPGRNGRLHIWRCYDYPHIVLAYYHMYRVAKHYPHLGARLSASEYLRRAARTAIAMFTVPYAVEKWSAYYTGFYNEVVIVDLIDALDAEAMAAEATELRTHWQRKVRAFVRERPNLFQSEYAFDSTGFESTHALARYAWLHAQHTSGDEPEAIRPEEARQFMERQLAANLFCRGCIEPAYYYLGSDYRGQAGNAYTLSYMAQMGGWAVLDYALHFADDPYELLRIGYASQLSSWALLNSGTPESNFGYWYPGAENDGGAGGGFEPAAKGRTWLEQPHHRGAWYYACEIDLGFCGALRAAATILADDPIFGRVCYGGDWQETPEGLAITPHDGVRRRVHAVAATERWHLTLDNDRFAPGEPVVLDLPGRRFACTLETENPAAHHTVLRVGGLPPGEYALRIGDEKPRVVDVPALLPGELTALPPLPYPAGGGPLRVELAPHDPPRPQEGPHDAQ